MSLLKIINFDDFSIFHLHHSTDILINNIYQAKVQSSRYIFLSMNIILLKKLLEFNNFTTPCKKSSLRLQNWSTFYTSLIAPSCEFYYYSLLPSTFTPLLPPPGTARWSEEEVNSSYSSCHGSDSRIRPRRCNDEMQIRDGGAEFRAEKPFRARLPCPVEREFERKRWLRGGRGTQAWRRWNFKWR